MSYSRQGFVLYDAKKFDDPKRVPFAVRVEDVQCPAMPDGIRGVATMRPCIVILLFRRGADHNKMCAFSTDYPYRSIAIV
jgi:hypothetical protein